MSLCEILNAARPSTTISFKTTINNSYSRLVMATKNAPMGPDGSFHEFTPPNFKSYQPIFNFFIQNMRRLFLSRQ